MVAFVRLYEWFDRVYQTHRQLYRLQLLTDIVQACTAWTIVLRWTVPYDGGDPGTARDNAVAERTRENWSTGIHIR